MQLDTGTLLVVFAAQVTAVQLFAEVAPCAVHEATPTGPTTLLPQLVVV